MSLFGALDRSTRSPVVAAIGPRSLLALLCPALHSPAAHIRPRRRALHTARPVVLPSPAQMDNLFIRALVQAGSCPQHARRPSTCREPSPFLSSHHKTRRRSCHSLPQTRTLSTTTPARSIIRHAVDVTREELKSLVDFYNSELDPEEVDEETIRAQETWEEEKQHRPWKPESNEDAMTKAALEQLLKNEESSHSKIYAVYQLLPYPRIPFLSLKSIRRLLHVLSVVERHDHPSMQRYLSILDDMKIANIPVQRSEWTSAMAFAGHGVRSGPISDSEVQSMLYIWKEMESDAGVKGNNVTFNVLFDVAFKAGKYDLAQAFLKEIAKRKLRVSRYLRTSLIHYNGVRQNGPGVRKAYADLVEAGEIVDTVVLNSVVNALFRAREPSAAEAIFLRMKAMHGAKKDAPPPPYKWRDSRRLGLDLDAESRRLEQALRLAEADKDRMQELSSHRQVLQNAAPIAPDTTTYALVIRYHAQTAGNIDRVAELIREMQDANVPFDGNVFLPIIRGFSEFGGVRYSSWTADKLELFYEEFVSAVDRGEQSYYIGSSAAVLILKAFAKTAPGRTLVVWEELRRRWGPDEGEVDTIWRLLRRLVPAEVEESMKAAKKTHADDGGDD
ncbi:pentatricopeptide repeat protein-like protein [Lophium mytilinum]|uniref:Pentatricopeptide repeat protein-like protein n=1 Tax=Lophium mytilinum TaxID=390894 RepID=A0A6A6QG63_9PEZI|nr:pentatricopeptide repeat protein-like protein [Lophium mytilinum]